MLNVNKTEEVFVRIYTTQILDETNEAYDGVPFL